MFFHPKNLKSGNNNPWFKQWFNILMHKKSIVCATVDSCCLEYLGCITLTTLLTSILEQLSVFTVVAFPNEQCQVVSDKVTKGTCMTSTECSDFAGTKDGNCAGGFGVCCLIG